MPFYASSIDCQCAGLFLHSAGQKSAGHSVGKIKIAKFGYSLGIPFRALFGCGVGSLGDLAQEPLSLLSCCLGCPGGTMPANREPPLAALLVAIKQEVRDRFATLAAGTETRHCRIPHNLIGLEVSYLTQSDPLSRRHIRSLASVY
jgi:hypothetical protein